MQPKEDRLVTEKAVDPAVSGALSKGDEVSSRTMDRTGRVALEITPEGHTRIGKTLLRETPGGGIACVDLQGFIALEVTGDGRTHIYDLVTRGDGDGGSVTELHAFLAVGQSNMQGAARPFGPELDPEDPRIFQYGATRRTFEPATVPLDMHGVSSGLSPATTFAREYLKTQPAHIGVLLIPAAHGGTGFTHTVPTDGLTWTKGAASDPANALYELSVVQAKEALLASVAAGYPAILKGIIWHQGEGNGGLATATYSGYLDTLISDYRTELGVPDLPFLVGQMSPEGMEVQPSKYTVDRSHQETPARVQRTGFAPAAMGGTNYNDTTHFSRIGMESLGREYAAAYRRALDNKPGFGPLSPQKVTATFVQGTLTVAWRQQARRVTSYRVEYQLDGGVWIEVVRAWPMNLAETVTGLTGKVAAVRVICVNLAQETPQFTPTLTPHVTW